MKNFLIVFVLIFCNNIACTKIDSKKMNINEKKMNDNIYIFNYKVLGNYSIYINDIPLAAVRKERGLVEGLEYLNPLIRKSGKQKITVVVYPKVPGHKITTEDLKGDLFQIMSSSKEKESEISLLKDLSIPEIAAPQDSLVINWDFEAEVNYNFTDHLVNAENIGNSNQDILLKDLSNFYNNIYKILNEGNTNEYRKIFENSFKREASSMYLNNAEISKYVDQMVSRAKLAKGNMQPIKDYNINIGLDGKVFNLIDSNGKSPLQSHDSTGKIKIFGFKLYRDKNSGELKVF